MFIMLAAWRKTSVKVPVEERLGQTFSEAAVSITITSITDALAFGIGSITRLPAIRVFCLYSAVAIMFDYLYQVRPLNTQKTPPWVETALICFSYKTFPSAELE